VKVLFMTSWLGVGGIEVNLVRLTAELHRRGHEVVVASGPGVLVDDLVLAGGRHVALTMSYRHPIEALRGVARLRLLLKRERPDVVHVFSASSAATLWPALRSTSTRRRPAAVSTIMGLKMDPREHETIALLRAWGVTLGAEQVIITAPAIKRAVERLPIRRDRMIEAQVVGIPPADDVAPAALWHELDVPSDVRFVTTIGRLAADKSHHLFLEAAASVSAHRSDLRFLVVGDGPLREKLNRRHRELGLEGKAFLLGERGDVDAILRSTAVCVRPGVVEGFVGITVLEAQAVGIPVVGFRTEDIQLAIEDGVTGVLVPPGDVAALAHAIVDLVDDPARASAIAEAGRKRVEEQFSISAVVDRLLEIYDAAIDAA
jgi:glycosyltransferase involved in cell wall biosynthesis